MARAWRLQIIVLLAVAAFVAAAVAVSWASGADAWQEAGPVSKVKAIKPLYNEELEVFIVRTPDGLRALSARGPLRDEKIEFCLTSKMFGGSYGMFDRYGNYYGGSAPRGMTRFPLRVEEGTVLVQTQEPIEGPPRQGPTPLEPEGPLCLWG